MQKLDSGVQSMCQVGGHESVVISDDTNLEGFKSLIQEGRSGDMVRGDNLHGTLAQVYERKGKSVCPDLSRSTRCNKLSVDRLRPGV